MKSSIFALLIACIFALSPSAFAANQQDPAITFVDSLSDTFINKIFVTSNSEKNKVKDFRATFQKNCDIPFISKFVLGKAYKTASEAERTEFQKVFSENVVLTWAGRFKEYSGQTIKVKGTRPAQSGQIYVDSQVISPKSDAKPISLVWRLRNNDGYYKIADLIVEGVSMVMTYRNEYTSILQSNGGSVAKLTETLQKKNENMAAGLGI